MNQQKIYEPVDNELVDEEIENSIENTPAMQQAKRQASQYLRRNRREWKRLHQHANDALYEGNRDQYVYAIKKMRDMLRQPYTDHLIESMWISSRATIEDLLKKVS